MQKLFLSLLAIPAIASVSFAQMASVHANGPDCLGCQVDLTSSGFGTPDAVVMFVVDTYTQSGSINGEFISVGFTDFGSGLDASETLSVYSEDGVFDTDTNTIVQSAIASNGSDGTLYTVAAITDGVRVTAQGLASVDYEIMCWLIKADNVRAFDFDSPATLNGSADFWQADATDDWTPNTAFLITCEPTYNPTFTGSSSEPDLAFTFGMADWASSGGTVTQYSYSLNELDGEAEGDPYSYLSDGYALATATDQTTLSSAIELSDVNVYAPPAYPDIHMTTRESAGSMYCSALIIDWPSTYDHSLSLETGPTSTGNWSVNVGFEPDFVGVLQTGLTAADLLINNNTSGVLGFFAYDGSSERNLGFAAEYSADPTNVHVLVDSQFHNIFHDGTTAYLGTTSFNSTGMTVNFSQVSSSVTRGRKWPMLLIGD